MKPRANRPHRASRPALAAIGFVYPGERWLPCFGESLLELVLTDLSPMGRQRTAHPHGKIAVECGSGGIVDGRNTIARTLLDDTTVDWLLMLDSDGGYSSDVLERLIAVADPVERPVVGALAFGAKKDGRAPIRGVRYRAYPTLMQYAELDDGKVGFAPMFNYPADQLVQVGGTGCHCLLIHRSALAAVRDKFAPKFELGEEWFHPITHPTSRTTFSEDLSFCLRLAATDIPVYVHTGIKTTHDKGFAMLDEEFYVAQELAAGRLRIADDTEEARCPQPARS